MATTAFAADINTYKPAAEPLPPERKLELSANVALTTDYVFRGISQTDENAAVQGGFDLTYGSFYAGVWASSLDFGGADTNGDGIADNDIADIEIDWYAGFTKSWNSVDFDLGVIYYTYPNAFDPAAELDFVEFKFGVSYSLWHNVTSGFTLYYSPDFTGETGDTITTESTLEKSFGKGWAISGLLGHLANLDNNTVVGDLTDPDNDEYWYWNIGLSKTFYDEKFTADIRYWDTSADGCGANLLFQCDERVVGTLKASF
ncbi:MAG: TorF family putative porin [Hyphomicrobiales bacterium]